MKILDTILAENELDSLKQEILEARKKYRNNIKSMKKLEEALGPSQVTNIQGDLDYVFDEAKKRFAAAQRAVAIANKLNDPEQKSRVWSNLNQLRAFVKNLTKQIEVQYAQILQQAKGSGLFQPKPAATDDVMNMSRGGPSNQQPPGNATGVPPRMPQQ